MVNNNNDSDEESNLSGDDRSNFTKEEIEVQFKNEENLDVKIGKRSILKV